MYVPEVAILIYNLKHTLHILYFLHIIKVSNLF